MSKLKIPDKAYSYILFQRTAYFELSSNLLYRALHKLLPSLTYKAAVKLESATNRHKIQQKYVADMESDYRSLQSSLPPLCSALLDIGCGVAGIDALIWGHYQQTSSNNVKVYLLDKSKVEEKVFYEFNAKGAFYNSLDVAKELLVLNGVGENNIVLLEANDANNIPIDGQVDLVMSLISWGFHYPVHTYLEQVHSLLSPNGRLILDVRNGSGGLEELRTKFPHCEVIVEGDKYSRVLCIKVDARHG